MIETCFYFLFHFRKEPVMWKHTYPVTKRFSLVVNKIINGDINLKKVFKEIAAEYAQDIFSWKKFMVDKTCLYLNYLNKNG